MFVLKVVTELEIVTMEQKYGWYDWRNSRQYNKIHSHSMQSIVLSIIALYHHEEELNRI